MVPWLGYSPLTTRTRGPLDTRAGETYQIWTTP